jgi:eukaryotic-like serine/threonine-protein kinase
MDEETLFHAALARASLSDRAAFLDAACAGKPELRAAVEALLAAHEASGPFLDVPTDSDATIDSKPVPPTPEASLSPGSITIEYRSDAKPNALIAGRYTLQERIGEGGMGEVWVAKQSAPVKRRVALKLIKTGMDSRTVLQRFEQERQALAMMDHPNIAKVLDAGMTPNGQPFFVMELVNGLPLNKFCDDARLTTRDRLELFVTICHAVQHAHQKGIVHRDLKPANILVTIVDGKPMPKVIDFGVAKATGGKLTDESMSTIFGSVVGTLEYMSPEQAGFSGMDIDTRADIYSLGVILYELLTGLRPIDAARLKKAAMTEMIRIIREEEPSKPSTRLSTNESLPSMAALRQIEPRKLMALLRGELDWVVMKCLEKNRERRYETASGLARDLRRYLADEPVEARPPSAGYRLGKFLRRNKGPVIAASLVVLALAGGVLAVVAVQSAANTRLSASLDRETRANTALASANDELTRSRAAVQARYDLAVEAIKTFHTGVSEDFLLKEERFKEHRDRLLKTASDFYAKLGTLLGRETDAASRRALAQSNFELAELTRKVGRPEAALAAHRAVLSAREALAAGPGADAGVKAEVGRSQTAVASLLETTGKTDDALTVYRRSESLLAALAGSEPAARAALANCRSRMGQLLFKMGRKDEAFTSYRQARADQEALAAGPGASNDARRDLADTISRIALLLLYYSRMSEAEAEYRTALAIRRKLADDNPAVAEFRASLAVCHYGLGTAMIYTDKLSGGEAEYRAALAIRRKLADDNPAVTEARRDLAAIHHYLGWILTEMGRPSEAEAEYYASQAIAQNLADDNPNIIGHRNLLALNRTKLGLLLLQTGKPGEAESACRTALAIMQKLADDNPSSMIIRNQLPFAYSNLGDVVRSLGRVAEAKDLYDRMIALTVPTDKEDPTDPEYLSQLVGAVWRRGLTLRDLGDTAGAAADVRRAMQLSEGLPPRYVRYLFEKACSHAALASLAGRAGSGVSAAEGEAAAARAMQWLRRAVAVGYRNTNELRIESALDPLRDRPDFQALMMDLAFPADAFAR